MLPIIAKLLSKIQVGSKVASELEAVFVCKPFDIKWRWPATGTLQRFFVDLRPLIAESYFMWIRRIAYDKLDYDIVGSREAYFQMCLDISKVINQPKVDQKLKRSKAGKVSLKIELFKPDVRYLPVFELCKINILKATIQAEHIRTEIGKKGANVAVPTTDL